MSGPTAFSALPTPFDPPSGVATVATPTCCCCCCCCLNSLAALGAYTATSAYYDASASGASDADAPGTSGVSDGPQRGFVAAVVGASAVPLGLLVLWSAASARELEWGVVAGLLIAVGLILISRVIGKRNLSAGVGAGMGAIAIAAAAVFVEFVTFGLMIYGQLAAPVTAFVTVLVVRNRRRQPAPVVPDWPPPPLRPSSLPKWPGRP